MLQALVERVGSRGWRGLGLAAATLCALLAVALDGRDAVGAPGDGCAPTCVILIQVDGLEPEDVTPATTPHLWSLAHPPAQAPSGALAGRSGWIWQAPRSVVSTGTGSTTASLLTGGYPEFSGVPSDDFFEPEAGARQRLGAGGFGDRNPDVDAPESRDDPAGPLEVPPVTTLIEAVRSADGDPAVFLGDPALAGLAHANGNDTAAFWYPPGEEPESASLSEPQFTGDSRLCPIPRFPGDSAPGPGLPTPAWCPANDMTTLQKAAGEVGGKPKVSFTFIHLAELGAAKRLSGNPNVDPDAENAPPQPPQALANTDAAIAAFAERYAQLAPDKWSSTVLMVVGSHGYQATPLARRVPAPSSVEPGPTNPAPDVADFVKSFAPPNGSAGDLKLVPQGTMATIYHRPRQAGAGDPKQRASALAAIKAELESTDAGSVNAQCESLQPDLGECVSEVLYLDQDAAAPSETVAGRHPSWKLDVRDPATGRRTRGAGDLVVLLRRGWATGRAVGVPQTPGTEAQPLSNPNVASSGGPQERAVAALINGPRGPAAGVPGAVRNLGDGVRYYPVSNTKVDPGDHNNPPPANDPKCPDNPPDVGGLACANHPGQVGDDADDDGHEAQPETVDFAITISALMQLPFDDFPTQLQGRVLQEAFLNRLSTPCVADCDPPPPVEPEPEPEILPPPPPPVIERREGFNFRGLVQKLRAIVVDSRNRPYRQARPGATMSTIRLEADFGKPEAAVSLTFYRRSGQSRRSARGARVVRLKPMARFDPFVVKRGHVTMKLRVPRQFRPTYVGVTVREIARTGDGRRRLTGAQPCTRLRTLKPVRFRCTGPARGLILPIADAGRLHDRKGGPARPAPRRRR